MTQSADTTRFFVSTIARVFSVYNFWFVWFILPITGHYYLMALSLGVYQCNLHYADITPEGRVYTVHDAYNEVGIKVNLQMAHNS